MLPQNYKLEYSAEQIAARVKYIAKQAQDWLEQRKNSSSAPPLVVPILRGGVFFFCDLVRQIDLSVEMGYLRSQSYEGDKFAAQKPQVQFDVSTLQVKDRDVLLIDDILDSGRSLAALGSSLQLAGAREIKVAVLVCRKGDQSKCKADWVGFDYPGEEWLVGYGMDDRNCYCNLPQIYSIQG